MSAVHEFARDADVDIAALDTAPAAMVADRYEVQPAAPLPDLSLGHARAFAARDIQDPEARIYALVLTPQLPARDAVLRALKGLGRTGIVEPLAIEPAFWPPTNQYQPVLIVRRPPGRPLMASLDSGAAMSAKRIIDEVIAPLTRVLQELSDIRISHRNIRPTNLFQAAPGTPVVLGECFSAPPGYAQPAIFEPIERAMAMPAGRGEGGSPDDLYALGITILFLLRGGSPLDQQSDAQIIHAKLEAGTYAALTAAMRPPAELSDALRGLLIDNPAGRWTVKDLTMWLMGTRRTPPRDARVNRSESPFRFGGLEHYSRRSLAYAMSQDWAATVAATQAEGLDRWLRHSLKDRALADAVTNARHSSSRGSPRLISDDLLAARVLTILDPEGPLRFRGFSAMPDGIAGAVTVAAGDPGLAGAFSELVVGMLPSFWSDQQPDKHPGRLTFQDLGMKLSRIISQNVPGQGVERCLYTLNPALPCLSPRVVAECATTVTDVLAALDAHPDFADDPPVDRHVAAYLASHMTAAIDRNLNEIGAAATPAAAVLAHLRLLALAQRRHGPLQLPGLTAAFQRIVGPVLDTYHNLPLRERLKDDAEKATARGALADLLGVIDNDRDRRWDRHGYAAARDRFDAINRHVRRLRDQRRRHPAMAARLGHRVAASISTVLAMLAAAAIFLTQMP